MLTLKEAETIYCYLIDKKMEFCFYAGVLVSRDYCKEVISSQSIANILIN